MKTEQKRISVMQEWLLMTRQSILILLSGKKNLAISMIFPVIAVVIMIWVAGKDMFVHYDGTKSADFVLVSAAIWGGLFNSIQTVVKERGNIKRDYAAGLRLRSYTASRALVQFMLCAVQSAVLLMGVLVAEWVFDHSLPESGVFFQHAVPEYYISLLLLMYAADAMGLMCSCMVRKAETASVLLPYILIVQLIFSGILFTMEGAAEKFSYLMLSHWGMEALGSISNLNGLSLRIQLEYPELAQAITHTAEDMYQYSSEHLIKVWIILAAFAAAFVVIGNLSLHRVSAEGR